jgi:hypothetical protein
VLHPLGRRPQRHAEGVQPTPDDRDRLFEPPRQRQDPLGLVQTRQLGVDRRKVSIFTVSAG